MASVDSLMLGGYEPDTNTDLVSGFDLWVEEHEKKEKYVFDPQHRPLCRKGYCPSALHPEFCSDFERCPNWTR